jgi:hypothetical protein
VYDGVVRKLQFQNNTIQLMSGINSELQRGFVQAVYGAIDD